MIKPEKEMEPETTGKFTWVFVMGELISGEESEYRKYIMERYLESLNKVSIKIVNKQNTERN